VANRLSTERRARIVSCLVEGMSINATCRITGTAKNTVLRLLGDLGDFASYYPDMTLRDLPCRRIQADEIWSFVYGRDKRLPEHLKGQPGYGAVWTWVALDPDTKLVAAYLLGDRTADTARIFMESLAFRLAGRVQLTTDGHNPYLNAIAGTFGIDIDYARVVKEYEARQDGSDGRYVRSEKIIVTGAPDDRHISTSLVERQNLTMRMGMRRFTRRTNAHSKKIENHFAAISLHFLHYNFARVNTGLPGKYKRSPAMAAGLADHVWTVEEIITRAEAEGFLA
jgi:IS1 family transposase